MTAALFDPKIERTLAGACIGADGYLEALLEQGFATEHLTDFHAKAALDAAVNLRARGSSVTAVTVRGELESTGFQDLDAWFPAVIDLPATPPLALVQSWGRNIATKRTQTEQRIDEHDAWQAELVKAATDVKAKLEAAASGKREPMFGTDAIDLLQRQFDGARWLVEGLVTRGGTAMIGAEPKTAKTWMGLEIALGVATGSKAFGEFRAERGRVAYFFAEDLGVQVRNRIRALLAGAGRTLEPGRLFLQPRGEFIDVMRDEDLAWIVASCRKLGALDVLVLDPLRDVHSGEENESDSMRDVMRRLRVLGELLDCTVIVVHHAAKATKDGAKRRPGQNLRGSSAIHGSIDSGIYLENADSNGVNTFTSTVTSQIKGARSAGVFELELRVTDNGDGEAERAEWTFSRPDAKQSAKTEKQIEEEEDDAKMLAWVRDLHARGDHLGRTKLVKHDERPIPEKRAAKSLDRLIDKTQLRLRFGLVEPVEIAPHWTDADD